MCSKEIVFCTHRHSPIPVLLLKPGIEKNIWAQRKSEKSDRHRCHDLIPCSGGCHIKDQKEAGEMNTVAAKVAEPPDNVVAGTACAPLEDHVASNNISDCRDTIKCFYFPSVIWVFPRPFPSYNTLGKWIESHPSVAKDVANGTVSRSCLACYYRPECTNTVVTVAVQIEEDNIDIFEGMQTTAV